MTSPEMKDALNRYEVARHNATSVEDPDGTGYEEFKGHWLAMKRAETGIFEMLCAMFTAPDEAEDLDCIKIVFADPIGRGEFIREMIWNARK